MVFTASGMRFPYTVDGVIAAHKEEPVERCKGPPHVDPGVVPLLEGNLPCQWRQSLFSSDVRCMIVLHRCTRQALA